MIDSSITVLNPKPFTWFVWPFFPLDSCVCVCVCERGRERELVCLFLLSCDCNLCMTCPWSSLCCLGNQVISSWISNHERHTHIHKHARARTHTHTHTHTCKYGIDSVWLPFLMNTSQLWTDWICSRILICDSLKFYSHTNPSCSPSHTDDLRYVWKINYISAEFCQSSHSQFYIPIFVCIATEKTNIIFHIGTHKKSLLLWE